MTCIQDRWVGKAAELVDGGFRLYIVEDWQAMFLWLSVCTVCALRGHCVHTAHTEARILTQEYLSPVY